MNTHLFAAIAAVLRMSIGGAWAVPAGDRAPEVDCVFPERMLWRDGGEGIVLDVTKPPFGARPDGKTDCTAALVKAYDFVLARMDEKPAAGGGASVHTDLIIYLPDGVYRVSDTIIHSGPPRVGRGERERFQNPHENINRIHFYGQSRAGTVIQLVDGAKGFAGEEPKPVLSFGKTAFNNTKSRNTVQNLTINVGNGNPGAVGIRFNGANMAELRNLRVCSGDGAGQTGISFAIAPVVGVHRDLVVEGFDRGIGITAKSRATHVCLEYVTLRGQREAGLYVAGGGSASVRKLRSENAVPPVRMDSRAAYLALLDSLLISGSAELPREDVRKGVLFRRNVTMEGQRNEVTGAGVERRSDVVQRVTGDIVSLGGKSQMSLRLPVEEAPEHPWERRHDRWVCPEDFGARCDGKTDDTKAVQAALDSGKPVFYLPRNGYRVTGRLTVPGTVKTILGFWHGLRCDLEIPNGDDPLRIERLDFAKIRLKSSRTINVAGCDWTSIDGRGAPEGSKVFLENGSGLTKHVAGLRIWGRAINSEGRHLPVVFDNCRAWMFGFKTERGDLQLDLRNGAELDLVGATFGVECRERYVRAGKDCRFSITGNTSGFGLGDEVFFTNPVDGREWRADSFPTRSKERRGPNVMIPLVVFDPEG